MIHYSADGTLAVVHGLLPVGRLVIAARLVLVEARHCCGRRLLLRDAFPGLNGAPPQILRLRRVHGLVQAGLDDDLHIDVGGLDHGVEDDATISTQVITYRYSPVLELLLRVEGRHRVRAAHHIGRRAPRLRVRAGDLLAPYR